MSTPCPAAQAIARRSGGSPTCQSPVPAESTCTRPASGEASIRARKARYFTDPELHRRILPPPDRDAGAPAAVKERETAEPDVGPGNDPGNARTPTPVGTPPGQTVAGAAAEADPTSWRDASAEGGPRQEPALAVIEDPVERIAELEFDGVDEDPADAPAAEESDDVEVS